MTALEMSSELDVIYENINKGGAPGLDGYEKSVILTHAQEMYVKEVLKTDPSGERFPILINTYTNSSPVAGVFDSSASVFTIVPHLKILNEEIKATVNTKQTRITVLPISPEEFTKNRASAYKYPPRRRAWRLPIASTSAAVEVYLRAEHTNPSYTIRYIKKPRPIIVADLHVASPFAMGVLFNYSIVNAGTGYSIGDELTVVGGTSPAKFKVSNVSVGTVTEIYATYNGYGMTTGTKATTSVPSSGRSGCTISIGVTDASTIDGEYQVTLSELDAACHRDILNIAAALAEKYYMDKYGNDNGTSRN